MKRFEKYLAALLVGGNIGMSVLSFLLSNYTLAINQLLLALFIFLYYNEREK